ncbi:expansin-like B1-like [Pyrus ussuriensis x Pyrus communis]|uniref:Expansin-like B1-like n=1 Tax=Pyrus ussuriensis x Pyrus communis TaxID=2448454 RepID=A0A5N5FD27_9ROSA|nr:expansin-like B1-like [Pyrus ussuriensis x Pyrus communis]
MLQACLLILFFLYRTAVGACGFGSFGATINGGGVSGASDLYRNGVGCDTCYQVRCTNSARCSKKGVTVVITDQGSSDRTDFILSKRAFGRMAKTTNAAASLFSLGIVDIEYRRVSCSYPNKNITITIEENSNYLHYLALAILYQQGKKDITAIQLCETNNFVCKVVDRSYGAVWTTTSPPNNDDCDENWVLPHNNIPRHWKVGQIYESRVQVN